MKVERVVIVGLGGVGTRLAPILCQYLNYAHPNVVVVLIDGDKFEPKNADRQDFLQFGNKAEVTAELLANRFEQITIEHKSRYVTEDNVFGFIPERTIVFACVDNHATRKLLNDHLATLSDGVLISGGNDFDDGNVRVYIREGGKNLTPPLTYQHPEIEFPKDKNPAELDCLTLAATGTPQLIFANNKVACEMANLFWVITQKGVVYTGVYFDLKTGAQRPERIKEDV